MSGGIGGVKKTERGDSPAVHSGRFNRKFNTRRKNIERWHNIVMRLSEFGGLITDYDGMTPEDVRAMRAVHRKLWECSVLAKERLKEAEDIDGFLRKNVQIQG